MQGDPQDKPVVLTVDVGGSNLKIRSSAETLKRKMPSGRGMTAPDMVAAVRKLAGDWQYDAISIGFPGPVRQNRAVLEPMNLGGGWVDFDFGAAFGKPTKLVNDAVLQAVGSYDGGRMLFLGLGTGLGVAMVAEGVALATEIAHLPYRRGRTYEDYLGAAAMARRGKTRWRESLFDIVRLLRAGLVPDYVVLGGGNVDLLKELPEGCRRGDNEFAFRGGYRLWWDPALKV